MKHVLRGEREKKKADKREREVKTAAWIVVSLVFFSFFLIFSSTLLVKDGSQLIMENAKGLKRRKKNDRNGKMCHCFINYL